ncbi:hypothetical protein PybrP1_001636 [[Pythium] brassicae (nom. inval.)]|nr:hypothetical protein PybrP1_001636 [[Pythium] brassicae (nom. inval.)]
MGNTGSCEGPYVDIELAPQAQPLVVVDKRFVCLDVARLWLKETSSYSKHLVFKDVESEQVLFYTGPDKHLGVFLDRSKKPLGKYLYFVYRPDADVEKEGTQLFQVYVQQEAATWNSYLDTDLRVDFTDATTGKRCRIEIQGEWRYRPPGVLRDGFNLDIAPNVDTAFALLVCAIIDDDLKRLRRNTLESNA